jgi:hypothetical protein
MTKRIQKLALAVAALAALALGGAVFAQAQSPSPAAPHHANVVDRDNVQSGDQTTPDRPGANAAEQGGSESTQSSESTQRPESANNSDGPGGHADEPGNATADHQFQGNE